MINFENCDKQIFDGVGKFYIPDIAPDDVDIRSLEWITFNYAKTSDSREKKGLLFYLDDYQFVRLWNTPDKYIPLLKQFGAVCSPDFSQFMDMPAVMRIYNLYRKHWLAAYWQMHGIKVIPTICWSDENSFEYCFDGIPKNSVISISSVGTQKNEKAKELFLIGCREAIKRLNPKEILWYGKCPDEFREKAFCIEQHGKQIARRVKNGR